MSETPAEPNPKAVVTNEVLDLKLAAARNNEAKEHWKTRAIVAATVVATNTPLIAVTHYWPWTPW